MTDEQQRQATLRVARLLGIGAYRNAKPCRQGPGFQTCATCDAQVGEPCRFLEARRAMMDAICPSPAGGS